VLRRRRDELLEDIERLRRMVDEVVWEMLEQPMWSIAGELVPLAEVEEDEEKVTVTIDLPMVRKKDIKLNISGDMLEVKAEMQRCISFDRWGTVQRNCSFRIFHRTVRLPSEVIPEQSKATFKRGILKVELPKKKRHRIEIE